MPYLDNNATTAVHPQVIDAMLPYLRDHWHNPSSGYRAAKKVREAIQTARAQVADLIKRAAGIAQASKASTHINNFTCPPAFNKLP